MRRDLLLAGLALAALFPAAAPPAQTGPKGGGGVRVSGIVYAPDRAAPPAEKFMKPAAGAAVHLRDLPKGWDPKASKEPVVLQFRKGRITPEFACVQVGQRLVVRAAEGETFNLRAYSPARGMFGATLPPNPRVFTDTFPRPDDSVLLTCDLHATAKAHIQVVPTPGFALCDREGRFVLPRRLPKGEHVLRAFFPGAGWGEKTITLKGDEGEVRVALDLRPRAKAKAPRRTGRAATPREPPLPPGAVARLGDARYRHAGGQAVALSPDGRRLAVANAAAVTVYDLDTGWPAFRLEGPLLTEPPRPGREDSALPVAAVFTPDGKHLLTADRSAYLRVWDAATGRLARTIYAPGRRAVRALADHKDYVPRITGLYGCPGGSRLLVECDRFWFTLDPADWSLTYRAPRFDPGVRHNYDTLAVSGDGRLMVMHSLVDALCQYFEVADTHTGKGLMQGFHVEGIWHAALSVDGRRVAVSSAVTVKLWNVRKKRGAEVELAAPALPAQSHICGLAFTPDGSTLLAAGEDDAVVARWDCASGRRLPDLPANRGGVDALAVSADGTACATTGRDAVIRRLDLKTGRALPCGDGFMGRVAVALSADGRLAAGADPTGLLRVWAAPFTGAPRTLRRGGPEIQDLCFAPDGARLFIACPGRSVEVWDPAAGTVTAVLCGPAGATAKEFTQLALSPDGRRLVGSAPWEAIWAWDLRTGRLLWQRRLEQRGKGAPRSRPVFAAGGAEILAGGEEAQVVRLDAATGRERGWWTVPTKATDWPVRHLAATPDGRWVAAVPAFNVGETPPFVEPPGPSHHDCELVLFEPATGRVGWRKQFALHESIRALAFTPTGKWLLTAHRDGRLRGWERATGRLAFERVGPRGYVGWLHISADGRLAAANAAGAVGYVWSLTPE